LDWLRDCAYEPKVMLPCSTLRVPEAALGIRAVRTRLWGMSDAYFLPLFFALRTTFAGTSLLGDITTDRLDEPTWITPSFRYFPT
jgi:hypothetical protein